LRATPPPLPESGLKLFDGTLHVKCAQRRGEGGTQQSFIQGGSALRSIPFTLLYTILGGKRSPFLIPSIEKWHPFYIPSLELGIPSNCCKCTVFEV